MMLIKLTIRDLPVPKILYCSTAFQNIYFMLCQQLLGNVLKLNYIPIFIGIPEQNERPDRFSHADPARVQASAVCEDLIHVGHDPIRFSGWFRSGPSK
jgi:hypothetical protein